MVTAYDYMTARLADKAGVEMVLVGDSLGMVVLGQEDTTEVTVEQMVHHTQAAARGVRSAAAREYSDAIRSKRAASRPLSSASCRAAMACCCCIPCGTGHCHH